MSTPARRKKRFLAGFLAAVLAISVMPLAGTAQAEVLEPSAPGGFCEHAPTENPFPDVSDTDPALAEIICQAAEEVGISVGFPDGTFRPNASTTRRQMALFMVRLADLLKAQETTAGTLTALPPYDGVNQFPDSAAESAEVIEAINRLADAGIVEGTAPGTYSPGENVTRRQMLLFIVRLIEFVTGAELPEGAGAGFPDQPAQNPEVQEATNKLFEANVVEGKADGTFGYGDDVNRRQMTWFNMRTAQHHVEEGLVDSPFPPPAPTTNQAFAVTPGEEAVNFVSTSVVDNEGRRTYTVAIPAGVADVNLALFPAENVIVGTDGVVTFTSNAVATTTGVSFEVVNGQVVGTAGGTETRQVNDVAPVDGTITFSIDSTVTDEIVPVVYQDTVNDAGNQLDLDGTSGARQPLEPFGIGGIKNWVPTEAATGASTPTVTSVNRGLDYFIAGGVTYFYDSNDAFALNAAPLTMAQFEALLTAGDILSISYDRDEADQSVFNVTTDVVPPASNVTTTVGNFDGGTTNNDVRIDWTASAQPDALYDVYRSVDNDCTTAGDNTQIADNISATTVTDLNIGTTTTTRTYCVQAVGGRSGQLSTFASSTVTVLPAATAPVTLTDGVVVDVDAATVGVAGSGDVWKLYFNEPITIADSAALQITGANAASAVVERGVNSTWSLNTAAEGMSQPGEVLTITLNANLAGNPTYPAEITAQSGIRDVADNMLWDANTNDDVLNVAAAQVFRDNAADGSTTFQVVFNEAVFAASAQNPASYTIAGNGATNVTSAVLGADGRTVTLTVSTALACDAVAATDVTLNQTVVDTDGQTANQTGYVLVEDCP